MLCVPFPDLEVYSLSELNRRIRVVRHMVHARQITRKIASGSDLTLIDRTGKPGGFGPRDFFVFDLMVL